VVRSLSCDVPSFPFPLECERSVLRRRLTSPGTGLVAEQAPSFEQALLTGTRQRSPQIRVRDLSPPKLPIYLRSVFRFGFVVSSPLTWSRRPRIGFLFVTWRVLARTRSTAWFRSTLTRTFAGFLSTVRYLAAVALASCCLLRAIHLVS
jgi:hypothetical protein